MCLKAKPFFRKQRTIFGSSCNELFFVFILLHFLALTWIEINDQSKSFANISRTSFFLFCLKPNLYYVHVCFPYYLFSFRRLYKTINTTTEETANVSKINVPTNYISNLLWIIRTIFCRWSNYSALQTFFHSIGLLSFLLIFNRKQSYYKKLFSQRIVEK